MDKLIKDQVELMMYMVELLNIHFVYIYRLISELQSLIEVLEIEKLEKKIRNYLTTSAGCLTNSAV